MQLKEGSCTKQASSDVKSVAPNSILSATLEIGPGPGSYAANGPQSYRSKHFTGSWSTRSFTSVILPIKWPLL